MTELGAAVNKMMSDAFPEIVVEKAQKEVETMMREEGEAATLEVGVHGLHPELIRLRRRGDSSGTTLLRGGNLALDASG